MTPHNQEDRFDDEGQPLVCGDCNRPMYYSYADEAYHHDVNPERGCFLIPAEVVDRVERERRRNQPHADRFAVAIEAALGGAR